MLRGPHVSQLALRAAACYLVLLGLSYALACFLEWWLYSRGWSRFGAGAPGRRKAPRTAAMKSLRERRKSSDMTRFEWRNHNE